MLSNEFLKGNAAYAFNSEDNFNLCLQEIDEKGICWINGDKIDDFKSEIKYTPNIKLALMRGSLYYSKSAMGGKNIVELYNTKVHKIPLPDILELMEVIDRYVSELNIDKATMQGMIDYLYR